MICPENTNGPRLAFVHIPKTAGSSIRSQLAANVNGAVFVSDNQDRDAFVADCRTQQHGVVGGHLMFPVLQRVLQKENDLGRQFFCVLREPESRFISLYCFLTQSEHPTHERFRGKSVQQFMAMSAAERYDMSVWLTGVGSPASFDAAGSVIADNNIATYVLETEYDLLLRHLSAITGRQFQNVRSNVSQRKADVSRDSVRELAQSVPHVKQTLDEDAKLYQAAVNGQFGKLLDD